MPCEGLGVYPTSVGVAIDPYCQLLLLWRLRAALGCGRSGGDEETRTPDPLLAKEMLFRLSYVPLPLVDFIWWAFLDSNQRPLPYQGSALTS